MRSSFGIVVGASLGLFLGPHLVAAQTCSDPDGTPGLDLNGVVCCPLSCGTFCGGPTCQNLGGPDDLCCGDEIKDTGVMCGDPGVVAPCIIPVATTCSDGTEGIEDDNGVVCCTPGCTECAGNTCHVAAANAGLTRDDCCGGPIQANGVSCDSVETGPCVLAIDDDEDKTCSDGTEGVEDANGKVCCHPDCPQCGGGKCGSMAGAVGLTSNDCCGGPIQEENVPCSETSIGPCVLATPVVEETVCSDDVTIGVDGNEVVCCPLGCSECAGPTCGSASRAGGFENDECCGGYIKGLGIYCNMGDNEAPCILGGPPAPAPAPAPAAPVAPAPAPAPAPSAPAAPAPAPAPSAPAPFTMAPTMMPAMPV